MNLATGECSTNRLPEVDRQADISARVAGSWCSAAIGGAILPKDQGD